MKKSYVYVLVVVLVVVAAVVAWEFTAGKGGSMGNMSNMGSSSSSGQKVSTDSVTIANFAFSPANITVKEGTTVTWTNKDSVAHTVTETDGQTGPNSTAVSPGSTYSFKYTKAGTYHYHCSIHSQMMGTVTVTS